MAEVVTKGVGRVERTADRAQVDVTFEAEASTRNEAAGALAERVGRVEELLRRDGAEVRVRSLSVHDNWLGDRRAGARAQQRYVVRATDLAVLDELLSGLVAAEPAWLNGPTWELSSDVDAVTEAQQAAVADARRRAEGYAAALGARLGPLLRLADGDGEVWAAEAARATMAYGAGGAPGEPVRMEQLNLEAQQIVVTVRCSATWTLLD
ncbi:MULTISPECIES: SIMPL domain-containing protein [Actinosynnema]|uniref:SIMPL domain-containing protein n=1 Tax=Actinosynnema TaxID=40566 RepID=UPI0020A616A1|nr:SIMPL domain-containing protein [Actinosynnema pretiosum]MCP2093635.1 hypothetical protein [Actinosynnema pretiosum]